VRLDRSRAAGPGGRRGQGLVEFALLLPLFMLILLGMIEFGFIFSHDLTIEYATREGARAGAALDNGGGPLGCPGAATWQTVDPLVIAAVERVLTSAGSQVLIADVSRIVIYKADPTTGANDLGLEDVWTYDPGAGPVPAGDTKPLDFVDSSFPGGDAWQACSRSNAAPDIDSIGVSVSYTYHFQTPLAAVEGFFGGGNPTLNLTDKTVMQLNPGSS
jgi:TadE-like protein